MGVDTLYYEDRHFVISFWLGIMSLDNNTEKKCIYKEDIKFSLKYIYFTNSLSPNGGKNVVFEVSLLWHFR